MRELLKQYSDLPILESERLILKPLSLEFLSEKYVSWMNDEEVIRYLESGGNYTKAKLEHYLSEVEMNPKYFWAIVVKELGEHIGNIKIDPIDPIHQFGEYGIMIGDRNSWGKGIAREASSLVIDFCFMELNLRKINLGLLATNSAAIKLYEKLGFEQEAYFKAHVDHKGEFEDTLRMAIFNTAIK
jgi:RimJ/RimL family protein N-acetyltransferase